MSFIHIHQAVKVVQAGGVIAYPTEGVWGLGCDPFNSKAVLKILEIKERPWQKGLILIASQISQISDYLTQLNTEQRSALDKTWPGPCTWVVPCQTVPVWVRGDHHSIAIRVSSHPVVKALCDALGGPLVSTSANPSSQPPAKTKLQVKRYFGNQIDYIVPGALGNHNKPTSIFDAITGKQLR